MANHDFFKLSRFTNHESAVSPMQILDKIFLILPTTGCWHWLPSPSHKPIYNLTVMEHSPSYDIGKCSTHLVEPMTTRVALLHFLQRSQPPSARPTALATRRRPGANRGERHWITPFCRRPCDRLCHTPSFF